MPHTVDVEEMRAWMRDKENGYVTFAMASSVPKRLEICLAGGYRVWHGANIVYEGSDDRHAVRQYNEI